jgi:2-oxoisovalerate dehydrogenase E1 component
LNGSVTGARDVTARRLQRAYLVRLVEEQLLDLFAAGRVTGTTHTCIGQELSAVVLADSLDRRRDLIFSNHRCHGHYVCWTDDVEGLIAEVMGRSAGVCAGMGGSQHLCSDRFYSNGIQGGIVPVAAGLAYTQRLAGEGGIVAVCIGDGTLGEGVVYETFNIASKWELPLLVILENNLYAQSTSQSETLAGGITERAAAFGIRTFEGSTWAHQDLAEVMRRAADMVREEGRPAFVRVDTYRLAAHSKGDDDRNPEEIETYRARDPLSQWFREFGDAELEVEAQLRARVGAAVERAERAAAPALRRIEATVTSDVSPTPVGWPAESVLESINHALGDWMATDPRVLLIGEDIRSPYGGAFKVTRGLSDRFGDRVRNAPISEAAIVGIGNGLALGGWRPVVEIMFGDFITLAFDQLVNHASKFREMYDQQVSVPLVVRCPMGGGRGYGPTHSQSLEKHLAGVPGLTLLVMHGRTRAAQMYRALAQIEDPVLVIENKLLYRERLDAPLPPGYAAYECGGQFPVTLLRPEDLADVTVVAFGRMSVLAERAATQLATQDEVLADLIFPLQVSPLDVSMILESVERTRRLVVIEEGAAGFDLAAEVIARVCMADRGVERLHLRRVAAHPLPIPSAPELEQQVLPDVEDICDACLEVFDE